MLKNLKKGLIKRLIHPGEDITEVEESGFSTTETTLYVGNIQGYVVQVCPMSILLLQDTTCLHRLEVHDSCTHISVFSSLVSLCHRVIHGRPCHIHRRNFSPWHDLN